MGGRGGDAGRDQVIVRAALVLASELSLPAVLEKIVELAAEVAGARYGALGVAGPDGTILEFVTYGITPAEREAIGKLPEGHGLLGVLIDEGKPLRLKNIQSHEKSVGFPPHHPPMTSFLGVPVAIRGRVFGNLYLTEKQGADEFTEEDEASVIELARQAAVAVGNATAYQEAEVGRRRLSAVIEISDAIVKGDDVEAVLRLLAHRARELVGAKLATVAMPDPTSGDLVVRVADGDGSEGIEGMTIPVNSSVSGDVMRNRLPILITDAQADDRVHHAFAKVGDVGPVLFVPLAARDRVLGTLSVSNHPKERKFSSDDVRVVQAFAAQAGVAMEHARIQEELQRLALVADRERIAKELHDDVIQSLFAEGMALQASLSMMNDPVALETRITQSVENIDRVIRDLRNYIFGLRPGAAADRQLDRSLRDLAAGFEKGTSATIEVSTDEDAVSRLAGRSTDIVSAAREAISNAVRHSGGSHITVTLFSSGDEAVLEIADDGAGFDPAQVTGPGHGLGNLRSRAAELGGDMDIESEPGRGTWLRIRIPF
jgi:two-component system, NarL family, sensor histidine kinase DevS